MNKTNFHTGVQKDGGRELNPWEGNPSKEVMDFFHAACCMEPPCSPDYDPLFYLSEEDYFDFLDNIKRDLQ